MGDVPPGRASLAASGGLTPPAGGRGAGGHRASGGLIPVTAVGLLFAFALGQAVGTNNFQDFFIYRAGAVIGLRGESPYDASKIRAMVADQFPDAEILIANCGFFLPPGAIALFAPFAALPYPAAKVLWAVASGLSGAGALRLARTFGPPAAPALAAQFLPLLLLLNPLVLPAVSVGQTPLLFVGCVAAGQWCFERGRPAVGAVLWAVPFAKPHLALPLLPLAWYLGGWKRAAAVAAAVAGLTLAGCLIAGGSPLLFREYLDFLGTGHKAVVFNQADRNPQITSWNRLLVALGGPVIELSAVTTLAGYLVWAGLLAGRAVAGRERPSPAWAAAAAAVGGVLCCQVLGYELVTLMLVVPWARELFAGGRPLRGWLVAGLLVAQLVPREVFAPLGIESHRPFGVALLAVLVLIGPPGPVTRRP